ncbi:site-specific integrase [Mucilaginibacter sp. JRF]|uniref:site-specific integrase n=1 Tax=Mucilaginibacter sp. JRF TaxID=2780088 RepID=UPI001882D469|nr:site-specific integrase [Mucilaginibacter sp. JRF]MBE9584010.1 site-specific integrase [Mucilaginibacter sp. JRF]
MEVNIYLKSPNSNAPSPIFAKIYYHPVSFKYYLNEKVHPNQWDRSKEKAKALKGLDNGSVAELNARINAIKNDIQDVYRRYFNDNNHEPPTKDHYKYLLDLHFKRIKPVEEVKEEVLLVNDFFSDFIKRCTDGTRVQLKSSKPITENTLKTYRTAFKHFKAYQQLNNLQLVFDDLDLRFYESYKTYLMKTLQFANNSVGKYIQLLKAVMADAFELSIHSNQSFLKKGFAGFREDTDNVFLTEYELHELQLIDLSAKPSLAIVRDYFLLGCWTGVRYSDYYQIVPQRMFNSIIQIRQTKTKQLTAIPIDNRVKQIFSKYLNQLPRLISNQKTNKYLKELLKLVDSMHAEVTISYTKGGIRLEQDVPKWSMVSTHTARRSFATNKYLEGVPSKTIMAITGHRTEQAFFKYIKLHQTDHANIMLEHMIKSQQS